MADRRLDPRELKAWRGFLRAHASVNAELDAELRAAHGLPLAHYDVLTTLEDAPGHRLRMSELADAVLLSRSGLTRLCDRLARDGFVAREPDEADGRVSWACLTDEGRAALRRARPAHHAGVRRRFLAAFDDRELEQMGEWWDRLIC
jgi:DNA-binding MarR family transcriptional regulator